MTSQASSLSLLPRVFMIVGLLLITVLFLVYAADILIPIIVAFLIWFLLNVMAQSYQKIPVIGRFIPWKLALTLSIATVPVVGYFGLDLVVTTISDMSALTSNYSTAFDNLTKKLASQYSFLDQEAINKFIKLFRIEDWLGVIATAVTNFTSQLGIVMIYVIFLLVDQQYFIPKIQVLIKETPGREKLRSILEPMAYGIQDYIWVMTIVSALTGGFSYIFMLWIGLEHAGFWAIIIFLLNFIPTIGTFIGTLLPAIFAFLQFQDLTPFLVMLIGIGIIQFVIGNILLPKLAGNRLNLSQFVIVLSLFVWGAMWGVTGMFLAVPITSIMMITFSKFDATRPWAILLSQSGKIDEIDTDTDTDTDTDKKLI